MKNMIKRILLLLPVISVLLVALAVPAFADYSPETGWSDVGSGLIPLRTYNIGTGDFELSMFEGGWAFVIDDSAFNIDYGLVDGSSNPASIVQFIGFFGFVVDSNYYLSDMVNQENLLYFVLNDPYLAVYDGDLGLGLSSGQHIETSIYDVAYPNGFKVLLIPYTVGDGDPPLNPVVNYPPDVTMYNIFYPDIFSRVPFEVMRIGASTVENITSVWTEIMTWITSALNTVMGAFYVDGSLTLLGTLSVIGVSVGICFLLIALIQRFLHLRG